MRRLKLIMTIFLSLIIITVSFAEVKVVKINGLEIEYTNFTSDQIQQMKDSLGVYERGKNYNIKFNGLGTGFAPLREGEYAELLKNGKVIIRANLKGKTRAPVSFDNSTSNAFPPIGNQAGEGSCTCWAIAYYMKTFQEAQEQGWNLSGATWLWGGGNNEPTPASYHTKIFSPDFVYHQINSGYDSGSSAGDAMELIDKIGCCTWDKMPYDDSDSTTWPSEAAFRDAPPWRSVKQPVYYIYLDDTDKANVLNNIKTILSSGKLVSIVIDAGEYSNFDSNDLLTDDTYNSVTTNHANTFVGYDDNYGPYTENANPNTYGAFKVANSWGAGIYSWENVNDGFYWLSYEALFDLAYQWVFIFDDRNNYSPEYLAVINISHNARGDLLRTISRANPALNKEFDDRYNRSGIQPYPSHDVILDITDLISTSPGDTYTLKIYDLANGEFYPNSFGDSGTATIGTVNKFWIEDYTAAGSNYSTQTPGAIYKSSDTPTSTINGNDVFLYVVTGTSTGTIPIDDEIPKVQVYPNPVKAIEDGKITFNKLTPDCTLQIFTVSGQLIFEYINEDDSTSFDWVLENVAGKKIAAGIYVFYIFDENGLEQTGKIGIVK